MSDYLSEDDVHPDAPAGGGGPGHFRNPHAPHPEGHHSHSAAHTAHHYAHLSHEIHLAAEGAEKLGHQLHHAAKYASSLAKAKQVMIAHSRMATELKLMRRGMRALENAATKSGSAKAAEKLVHVKAAYAEMEVAFKSERSAAAAASSLMETEHAARTAVRGMAKIKLGQAVLEFESMLQGSAIGRGVLSTGRAVANPKFVKGLTVLGVAMEGVAGWMDSNAESTGGKAANAALSAGGGALVMANPIVAGADMVAPKGYKLSELYQGTAGALTAIGEGIAVGDAAAMSRFHERSKRGDYGRVMQAASEAGDYWANKGLMGGLTEFKDALKYSVESW